MSKGLEIKEFRVRMSGTASNRNYGNLTPDVAITFDVNDEENWDEALQRGVNVTRDLFEWTARNMLEGFAGYREADEMLRELGIRATTEISTPGAGGGTLSVSMESSAVPAWLNQVAAQEGSIEPPLERDGEEVKDGDLPSWLHDDDGEFDPEWDDGEPDDSDDADEEDGDTKPVNVPDEWTTK